MERKSIIVKLKGTEEKGEHHVVTPESVKMASLFDVLKSLEHVIEAGALDMGSDIYDSVPLVIKRVKEGSVEIEFDATPTARFAMLHVEGLRATSAAAMQVTPHLYDPLVELKKALSKGHMELVSFEQDGEPLLSFTADVEIEQPKMATFYGVVKGHCTTLWLTSNSVGIRTVTGESLTLIDLSDAQIELIMKASGEDRSALFRAEGQAWYDPKDLSIKKMAPDEIESIGSSLPRLGDLREQFEGVMDGVDVAAEVAILRYEPEDERDP